MAKSKKKKEVEIRCACAHGELTETLSQETKTIIQVDENLCIGCGSLHQGLPGWIDCHEGFPRPH